jgi:VanZ family protein
MSLSRGLKRLGLWLPPVACMAIIFYFSSQTDPVPELTTRVWDKLLHAGAYAVLGALFCRALVGEGTRPPAALVLAVVLASAYGAADEFHQSFVPLRQPEFADWVVDALGASIGAIGHTLGPIVAGR